MGIKVVILCGDSLYEIEAEADAREALGEKFVVCFTTEAIFVALKQAVAFGTTVILCGEHGKRATLHYEVQPCTCRAKQKREG